MPKILRAGSSFLCSVGVGQSLCTKLRVARTPSVSTRIGEGSCAILFLVKTSFGSTHVSSILFQRSGDHLSVRVCALWARLQRLHPIVTTGTSTAVRQLRPW